MAPHSSNGKDPDEKKFNQVFNFIKGKIQVRPSLQDVMDDGRTNKQTDKAF